MPTYDYACDACDHAFESLRIDHRRAADEVPEVQKEEAPPPVRRGGRRRLQRLRLLPDRLPQRVLQKSRLRRQAGHVVVLHCERKQTCHAGKSESKPAKSGE